MRCLMVGFNNRFGDNGCIAARGLLQERRISASALAAPAKGGSVPHVGHSSFGNAARRTNGGSGEAAAQHQIGWPAAGMGRKP